MEETRQGGRHRAPDEEKLIAFASGNIGAGEFRLFLLVAGILSLPVMVGLITPWVLALTGTIVVAATVGRLETVRRQWAQQKKELGL